MKRKLIIVILLVICLSFVGILICTRKNDDSVDVRNFKYGASPGNSIYGGACQGEKAFYYTNSFELSNYIYKLEADGSVSKLNEKGGDLRYWEGYIYFVQIENGERIVRMCEETGEIDVLASPEDYVANIEGRYHFDILSIVNGILYFDVTDYSENTVEFGFDGYSYNCDTGEISKEEVLWFDTYDYFRNKYMLDVDREEMYMDEIISWEYTEKLESTRQCYGDKIYTYERLGNRQSIFLYEPKNFYVVEDDGDCKNTSDANLIDTNVTAFNVSYEKVFYVRKEENENILTIYTVEHDGGNKQKITEIETDTEQWCTLLYVGDKYIVCQTSDWRENAEVEYINDRVYDTYIISIDGSNINKLEDVTQQ